MFPWKWPFPKNLLLAYYIVMLRRINVNFLFQTSKQLCFYKWMNTCTYANGFVMDKTIFWQSVTDWHMIVLFKSALRIKRIHKGKVSILNIIIVQDLLRIKKTCIPLHLLKMIICLYLINQNLKKNRSNVWLMFSRFGQTRYWPARPGQNKKSNIVPNRQERTDFPNLIVRLKVIFKDICIDELDRPDFFHPRRERSIKWETD